MPTTPVEQVSSWESTVSEHKREQLLRIGRAAVDLVTTQGISAATMSALARAVGISRATLYSYVPDISTAIRRYLAAVGDDFYASVAAAVAEEAGPEAQLRRFVAVQVSYAAGRDHHTAAALAALGAVDPPLGSATAHEHRNSDILERILDDGITAGIFRGPDTHVYATLISRLLYSAPELMKHHQLSEVQAADAIANLIIGGITSVDS